MADRRKRRRLNFEEGLCYLDSLLLPEEIFSLMLSYLPPPDIGTLCLTSEAVRDRVLQWSEKARSLKQLAGWPNVKGDTSIKSRHKKWLMTCREMATFAKRATLMFGTRTRLRHLETWHTKISDLVLGVENLQDTWTSILRVEGFAVSLNRMILGWDDCEYQTVQKVLDRRYSLSEKVRNFLTGCVRNAEDEGDLRLILRSFFWEHCSTRVSWLTYLLLDVVPMTNEEVSTILYLMLGPTCPLDPMESLPDLLKDLDSYQLTVVAKMFHHVDWGCFEEDILSDYFEANELVGELGQAMAVLHTAHRFPDNRLFATIDTFFFSKKTRLCSWTFDNMAALLLFTNEALVKQYLSFYKTSKTVSCLADLLVAMVIICDRMDNVLQPGLGVGKLLDWSFSEFDPKTKKKLYAAFWREVIGRAEEEELSGGMLIQLGCHVARQAYAQGRATVCQEEQQRDDMEE